MLMRKYIRTVTPDVVPSICGVLHEDRMYRLSIHYADFEEHVFAHGWNGLRFTSVEHTHEDVYHMVLYVDGDNMFSHNGVRHPSRRGVLALVAPGEGHFFTPTQKGRAAYVEVAYSFRSDEGLRLTIPYHTLLSHYAGREIGRFILPMTLDESSTSFAAGKIEELTDTLLAGGNLCHFAAHKAMMDIFSMLIIRIAGAPRETSVDAWGDVAAVKEFIESRYAERLTLTQLAQLANLTPEHLCRKFKGRYHTPPLTYQQKLRILAAENLLRTSGLSCKEIASAVGFCDEHFFSRAFKRSTGTTPSAFRKRA